MKRKSKEYVLQRTKEGASQNQIAREISETEEGELDAQRSFVRYHLGKMKGKSSYNRFEQALDGEGFDLPTNWEYGWLKTKKASVFVRNQNGETTFEDMREEFKAALKAYIPNHKVITREPSTDPHLLVVDIADLHIGKLASASESGEAYTVDIAIKRGIEGVQGILSKASGFQIEQILFVVGNDVLHTDNSAGTTTKGTRQDTDGSWFDNYKKAREMYVRVVEMLLTVADVHVVHNPSNHDYVTGYMLADSLEAWFRSSVNVTFDVTNSHRKYYKYGENLIGTSHGDGAKMESLPLIMANEAKRDWANTSWRYIYLHHLHHKKQYTTMHGKDYHGVTIEYLRSPSATDSWHHVNGYQHAPKAIEGFVHHKDFGQVARITHLFD